MQRPEVRDVLAWMRLLVDPHDAAAVVRALARPPIELRQVHLAHVIQLARRRKLDLVCGVVAEPRLAVAVARFLPREMALPVLLGRSLWFRHSRPPPHCDRNRETRTGG